MLRIDAIPPIVIDGPDLLGTGPHRQAIGGESPTVTVQIDNARGQHTDRFAVPPLRQPATYTDTHRPEVRGIVQSVRLGETIEVTIEQ